MKATIATIAVSFSEEDAEILESLTKTVARATREAKKTHATTLELREYENIKPSRVSGYRNSLEHRIATTGLEMEAITVVNELFKALTKAARTGAPVSRETIVKALGAIRSDAIIMWDSTSIRQFLAPFDEITGNDKYTVMYEFNERRAAMFL